MDIESLGEIVGSLALEPVHIPVIPDKLPVLNVTLELFEADTGIIVDNIEGGYYNPSMKKHFSLDDQTKLGSSGETLFGEDRDHGAALAKYPEWNQLWALVDSDRAKNPGLWKYGYKPAGDTGKEMIRLVSVVMYKWFQYLAGRHILISSMDEIAADERLLLHFIYACWNGEKWFSIYADALNQAIKFFPGDKEKIFEYAIKARTEANNPVIRQQGAHMMQIYKNLKLVA